jgi:hypothetical protein
MHVQGRQPKHLGFAPTRAAPLPLQCSTAYQPVRLSALRCLGPLWSSIMTATPQTPHIPETYRTQTFYFTFKTGKIRTLFNDHK